MYLSVLSNEEKDIFLSVAYAVASADGNYSDMEKAIIAEYCREMQMEYKEITLSKFDETLLERINEISSEIVKKIIIFEIIGLTMIDKNYDDKEKELVKKILDIFEIDIRYSEKCEEVIREYISLQLKINQLVME